MGFRTFIVGVALLCLGTPAFADQTHPIIFVTWPPDTHVTLNCPSHSPIFLGLGGQTVTLDLSEMGDQTCTLEFEREGYWPQSLPCKRFMLWNRDRYPEHGELRLVARNPAIEIAMMVRTHAWQTIVLLVLLGLLVFAKILPDRRRLKKQLHLAAVLEDLTAGAEINDSLSGYRLGGYRLGGRIAEGGLSRVYFAVPNDILSKKDGVAIKVIKAGVFSDEESRERFSREVGILRTMDHPAIVRIIDWGDQDGLLYIVMELLRSHTLRTSMIPGGQPLERAMKLLRPVFQACSYMHSRGVVHRNLKPENIAVVNENRIKILDFGLARSHDNARLTQAGQILGTPAYMAPEQVTGGEVDSRTDQYTLGLIAYELLSGERAFESEKRVILMYRQVNDTATPLRTLRSDLPEAVETVINRLMAKDPKNRYPSVDEALAALEQAAIPGPIPSTS